MCNCQKNTNGKFSPTASLGDARWVNSISDNSCPPGYVNFPEPVYPQKNDNIATNGVTTMVNSDDQPSNYKPSYANYDSENPTSTDSEPSPKPVKSKIRTKIPVIDNALDKLNEFQQSKDNFFEENKWKLLGSAGIVLTFYVALNWKSVRKWL